MYGEPITMTKNLLRTAPAAGKKYRWQNGKSWYKCRFRFFQNRMVNPHRKFSEPGFPHNFAKMIAMT
jgi:hypothetical protein